MVNKYESTILMLNKFAWIVCLIAGVVTIILGAVTPFGLGGGLIAIGVIGAVGGILGKLKVVAPLDEKKFEETWVMLLICAILGLICDGWAGALFLVQAILIKVGGK